MFVVKLFDYFSGHRKILWLSLVMMTAVIVLIATRLKFNEDISDFLPLKPSEKEAFSVYQNVSGANKIFILFSNPDDADLTVEAIDWFIETVKARDTAGICGELTAVFDMDAITAVSDFVYENAPYFLTDADYVRMDSLLARPGYIAEQLERDKEMMLFPSGGMTASAISHDPLALFTPLLSNLNHGGEKMNFEIYGGHLFTKDMSRAVVMVTSRSGNSETVQNEKLVGILGTAVEEMESHFEGVGGTIVGGPEIAVGNSSCIKHDTTVAILLSMVLILILLVRAIRSFRNIMLIFISIFWGWLLAVGGILVVSGHVSLIVIGISSVILGLAVNYPLHFIAHTLHEPRMKVALREIMGPLIVGNVTTVGAFLALIPLKAAALRDLGVFASLLLIGTIVFVLVYLPHFVKTGVMKTEREGWLQKRLSDFSPDRKNWIVAVTAVLTVVLAVFSFDARFDTDVSNINYMTPDQRDNLRYFRHLVYENADAGTQSVYVLSSGESYDEALAQNEKRTDTIDSLVSSGRVFSHSGVSHFIVSEQEQGRRLAKWKDFLSFNRDRLTDELTVSAARCGFAPDAFSPFDELLSKSDKLEPQNIDFFSPLTQTVFSGNFARIEEEGGDERYYVVDVLDVGKDDVTGVEECFVGSFDISGMNRALAGHLSENFNYIGWACSFIVFFFLWFSFGRIELALISFLPMAVSWLWILGIMAITGIQFNIVNIILATFIFGQGDDYTIFMTQGSQYEYACHRPVLASYKRSILDSALIMFAGIGTLIFARHPAMRSLAEVTIIGMFSVVFMAYLIPPFLFRWLTEKHGAVRRYPLTVKSLLFGMPNDAESLVLGRYIYKGRETISTVKKNLRASVRLLEEMVICDGGEYALEEDGYGEKAIYLALKHPSAHIVCRIPDDMRRQVASISASDFVSNVEFIK